MLLSILAHHAGAADPDLMDWIKHQLDAIFGLGPWLVVIGLGLLVLLIPLSILVVYAIRSRRVGFRQR